MNILVISHAANRSGAPLSLLALTRWLRANNADEVRVYSLRNGPLEGAFEAETAAALRALRRASWLEAARKRAPASRVTERVFAALQTLNARAGRRALDRYLRAHAIDAILVNSVAAGAALRALGPLLKRREIAVVVWVHELRSVRAQFAGDWNWCRRCASRFVAASGAVRDELIAEGLAPARVEVVYETVDFDALAVDKAAARRELRARLQLPADAFLIGGCGTMEARKGFDWWPQIALRVPAARLVWLGGDAASAAQARARGEELGVRLDCLPATDDPRAFFAALDLFCLPSREDPFPLVALEAAAAGVPIVCFAGAGGVPELIGADEKDGESGGICVPLGDVAALARALESLRLDANRRAQMGKDAARRARALCDVKVGGPRWRSVLAAAIS